MLEPLGVWKSEFASLGTVDIGTWAASLASCVSKRTTMKLGLMQISGPVQYLFNQALFQARLSASLPTDSQNAAALQIASSWESAVMASPMLVLPGASIGAPTPPTTWSVVAAVLDPPSVQMGKVSLVRSLSRIKAVDKGIDSQLAEALRNAFLKLSFTVTGINSLPIPSPLVCPMHPSQ